MLIRLGQVLFPLSKGYEFFPLEKGVRGIGQIIKENLNETHTHEEFS